MKHSSLLLAPLWCITAALLPPSAHAQAAPRPGPLDPQAATAPLVYRSALAGYRKLTAETPPLGWREANETVDRAGGWRALAREANAPEAPASAPAAVPAASAPRAARPAPPQPAHRH
jgi:hypothetical protein